MRTFRSPRCSLKLLPVLFAFLLLAAAILSRDLPVATSGLFAGSGTCATCHESNGLALVDASGNDLSLTTHWRSTMMANAFKDPYWMAKVEAEVDQFPSLKSVIEDKCLTCHAPMGRTQAVFDGQTGFAMESAAADPLSLDGVSCTLCHQIQPGNLGEPASFSGGYVVNDSRQLFGPYDNLMDMPMRAATGYLSEQGLHMDESAFCATCHTLFTPYLDDTGNIAGEFPEQVPFFEWQNSIYPAAETACQDCHMPAIDDPVRISVVPPTSPERSPFWKHHFVGGSAFMLQVMKDHGEALGVTATDAQFDSTRARTLRQLDGAVKLEAEASVEGTRLTISVALENQAGHKFPTGFPSRRAWLHVRITDAQDQVVFESGAFDEEGEIHGLEEGVSPHYDRIDAPERVQIYESVMVDVNGEPTTTLLRGARYVKDNRLPPKGFLPTHPLYDDMAVQGAAAEDDNFNKGATGEGTGTDHVTYVVNTAGFTGPLDIAVSLLYQSIAPQFAEDLFDHETPAVERFETMYESANKAPNVVQTTSLQVNAGSGTRVEPPGSIPLQILLQPNYPNPFNGATVIPLNVTKAGSSVVVGIFDLQGRQIRSLFEGTPAQGAQELQWDGTDHRGIPVSTGTYFARLFVDGRQTQSSAMVYLK